MYDMTPENDLGPDEGFLESDVPEVSPLHYDDLLFACTHLCDLLEIENDALTNHDAETVKVLAENKLALANLYESSVQPLIDDPDLVGTLTTEEREDLAAIGERLKELVEVNARSLKAEMEAYSRVMTVMVEAAKKHATNTVTYGKAGTFDVNGGPGSAISFNTSL
ncbi:conserved hypothetical protein [Candidatus Terasakiella magnetica]|nr:conserved hypothetical protein [Candidatus Terasakiella magnetica]